MTVLRAAALTIAVLLLLAGRAAAQPGDLSQAADAAACVSETGDGGRCVDGFGLSDAAALAISPDGGNVYVVAPASQTLAVFDRDAGTGLLTETACFTLWAQGDPRCARIDDGLTNPVAVTVSGDGRSVYVANLYDEVTIFTRDTRTGALARTAGQGCIGSWLVAGCPLAGTALGASIDVVVSPSGGDVYVSSLADAAIAELRRDPATSLLTQPAGRPACISRGGGASSTTGKAAECDFTPNEFKHPIALALTPDGADLLAVDDGAHVLWEFGRDVASGVLDKPSCWAGVAGCGGPPVHGMAAPSDVAASPDGRNVYVASSVPGGVAALSRGAYGSLAQAGCVSNDGLDGCVQGRALAGAAGVTVAPDGRDVYVAALASGSIAGFSRDPATGAVHQRDCISYDGSGGICTAGRLFEGVHSLVVSPDGRNVYAVSQNHGAVLTLDREQPAPGAPVVTAAPPAAIASPAAVAAAPLLTAFTASPRRFRAAKGTRLRLTLAAPAAVRIAIGRRVRLTARLAAGTHTIRLRGHRLRRGRYTAKATAPDGSARTLTLIAR